MTRASKRLARFAVYKPGLAVAIALIATTALAQEPSQCGEEQRNRISAGWTEQEKSVLTIICQNKLADLGADYDAGLPEDQRYDAKKWKSWSAKRTIRSSVFKSMLRIASKTDGPKAIKIRGAIFSGELSMARVTIDHDLSLEDSVFESGVEFHNVSFAGLVAVVRSLSAKSVDFADSEFANRLMLDGTLVIGDLSLNGARSKRSISADALHAVSVDLRALRVDGYLMMENCVVLKQVILDGATIAGSAFFRGCDIIADNRSALIVKQTKIEGQLDVSRAQIRFVEIDQVSVGSNLFLRDGRFDVVQLKDAVIGGQVAVAGSSVFRSLWIQDSTIGSSLFLRGPKTELANVHIGNSRIGGQASLIGVKLKGTFLIATTSITQDLLLNEIEHVGEMHIVYSKIGQNVFMFSGKFGSRVFTGTEIANQLVLAAQGKQAAWEGDSSLVLTNVKAKSIQDTPSAWPSRLQLNGLTYELVGGFDDSIKSEFVLRDRVWFREWLKKSPYSPQPYAHLAEQFKKLGYQQKGDDIRLIGLERERAERLSGLSWFWSTVEYFLIGHGFRTYFAIGWAIFFAFVGALVLNLTQDLKTKTWNMMPRDTAGGRYPWWKAFFCRDLYFSVDVLLPIVRLNERHYEKEIVLSPISEPYFILHKIMGYILASFLIAGLAGLTK